jgi:hypothetical protein
LILQLGFSTTGQGIRNRTGVEQSGTFAITSRR